MLNGMAYEGREKLLLNVYRLRGTSRQRIGLTIVSMKQNSNILCILLLHALMPDINIMLTKTQKSSLIHSISHCFVPLLMDLKSAGSETMKEMKDTCSKQLNMHILSH